MNQRIGTGVAATASGILMQTLGVLLASTATADTGALLAPTQGRPSFVRPGGELMVVAQPAVAPSSAEFALFTSRAPVQRVVLPAPTDACERIARGEAVALKLPSDVPQRTYDLEVRLGSDVFTARHCVAVEAPHPVTRLVHLSNMNVGDVSAPAPDRRLIEEINLIAPTLIMATGDLVDAAAVNPERSWQKVMSYLAEFDAPCVVACGDQDGIESYSRFLASSPIGVVDAPGCRLLVLLDHPGRPIVEDSGQIGWIEHALAAGGSAPLTVIASHDESPNLLRYWRERGTLSQMLRGGNVGLWLVGGSRDWDGREYRELVEAASPLLYVRTHQASTATVDGADGASRYRVLDIEGVRVRELGGVVADGAPRPSIAAGRLRVFRDSGSDASPATASMTITNGHSFPMSRLMARLRVHRDGDGRPWCRGAELTQVTEVDGEWDCCVRFDLPGKSARRIVVGTGPAPQPSEIVIRIDAPDELRLRREASGEGVELCSAGADVTASVILTNRGAAACEITPAVRIDGSTIAYRVAGGPTASAYRLKLGPGEEAVLELDLAGLRIAPGDRDLHVYLRGDDAWAPNSKAIRIVVE